MATIFFFCNRFFFTQQFDVYDVKAQSMGTTYALNIPFWECRRVLLFFSDSGYIRSELLRRDGQWVKQEIPFKKSKQSGVGRFWKCSTYEIIFWVNAVKLLEQRSSNDSGIGKIHSKANQFNSFDIKRSFKEILLTKSSYTTIVRVFSIFLAKYQQRSKVFTRIAYVRLIE